MTSAPQRGPVALRPPAWRCRRPPLVPPSVDEKGRCAGHPAQVGGVDILCDPVGGGMPSEVVLESLDVETEVLGVPDQIRPSEITLVLEQQVVHPPELGCPKRLLPVLGACDHENGGPPHRERPVGLAGTGSQLDAQT